MMTPISRIPLEADSPNLVAIVKGELDAKRLSPGIGLTLTELIEHGNSEEHISITLDWAMQIRNEMGISWKECIDAAMTLYFG